MLMVMPGGGIAPNGILTQPGRLTVVSSFRILEFLICVGCANKNFPRSSLHEKTMSSKRTYFYFYFYQSYGTDAVALC